MWKRSSYTIINFEYYNSIYYFFVIWFYAWKDGSLGIDLNYNINKYKYIYNINYNLYLKFNITKKFNPILNLVFEKGAWFTYKWSMNLFNSVRTCYKNKEIFPWDLVNFVKAYNSIKFFSYRVKINVKKKNVFFTFLNDKGFTLCKMNLGSSGFKKKKKFTGYAIQNTASKFRIKILTHMTIAVKDLIVINRHRHLLRYTKVVEFLEKYPKVFRFGGGYLKGRYLKKPYVPWKRNKRASRLYFNVEVQNNINLWPYRFIRKGLRRYVYYKYFFFIKFGKVLWIPKIPHSKGLRTKKKRRV